MAIPRGALMICTRRLDSLDSVMVVPAGRGSAPLWFPEARLWRRGAQGFRAADCPARIDWPSCNLTAPLALWLLNWLKWGFGIPLTARLAGRSWRVGSGAGGLCALAQAVVLMSGGIFAAPDGVQRTALVLEVRPLLARRRASCNAYAEDSRADPDIRS